MCDSVTAIYNADTVGTDTTAEIYIRTCVDGVVSTNSCNRVFSDAGAVTLNGDPTTGRSAIYGIVANWLYVEVSANADPQPARVQLICLKGERR